MAAYVDVHTHLTHEAFLLDQDTVIKRAQERGLEAIVVNGLEPKSNRQILQMAQGHKVVKAALGIYPVDAVNAKLPADFPIAVAHFAVDDEIAFIRQQAKEGHLSAIGECGLDGHWLSEETFALQEKVFESLLEIALDYQLPVIVHSRKRERRVMEILKIYGVKKVNFHCYGGKTAWAIQEAEKQGWYFSIPANARMNQAFCKLLKELPRESILTETDAPYLSPVRNTRNEPANVINTVGLLASLRAWEPEMAKQLVWDNYLRLFA